MNYRKEEDIEKERRGEVEREKRGYLFKDHVEGGLLSLAVVVAIIVVVPPRHYVVVVRMEVQEVVQLFLHHH